MPSRIGGLILAGGRGSRMGGVDKGLQLLDGVPLALNALRRLAPQVDGGVVVSANRHRADYEAMGVAVVADTMAGHLGPLAGVLAGLEHSEASCLVTVPCDAPRFPLDLAARLQAALESAGADCAMAATREGDAIRPQPAFLLVRAEVKESLRRFLESGGRKVGAWTHTLATVVVPFDDPGAFVNLNTLDELAALTRP